MKLNLLCVIFVILLARYSLIKIKQRDTTKDGCVIIYKDCNYEGVRHEICEDIKDFRIFNFKDQASSISLGKNVKVILYQDQDFQGLESNEIMEDQSCLLFGAHGLGQLHDKVNSIKIIKILPEKPVKGCVRIFEKCNYKGASYEFCHDRPKFPQKHYPANTVSSFWIGYDTEVQLFLDYNQKGESKSFSQNFDCLDTCVNWTTNQAKSASVFTVVKHQQKFTEEEIKKLEEEEKKEQERLEKESKPEYFSIVYSSYGLLDITEKVKSYVNPWKKSLTFSAFKDSFGSTLPGILKTSHLFYMAKSKICVQNVKDNEALDVSATSGGNCYDKDYTTRNLKIFAISFGGKDYTSKVRQMAKDDNFKYINATVEFFGEDPLPGWQKTLSIYYEVDNEVVKITVPEGEQVDVRTEAHKLADAEKARKEEEERKRKEEEERKRKEEEARKKAEEERKRKEEEERKKREEEKKMFSIIGADYGPFLVTEQVNEHIENRAIDFKIFPNFPNLPEGYLKLATVFHRANHKWCFRTVREGQSAVLNENADNIAFCHEAPAETSQVKIYLATFGGADVTKLLRERAKSDQFSGITASRAEFGNPLPGWQNVLFLYYKLNGGFVIKVVLENERIIFLEELEKAKKEEEEKKKKIEEAIEQAKKEELEKKKIFSLAGLTYGPWDYTFSQQGKVINDSILLIPTNRNFGNPWKGFKKTLHVLYWKKKKLCVKAELENGDTFTISKASAQEHSGTTCHDSVIDESVNVKVYGAVYGLTDVTEKMRQILKDNSVSSFTPTPASLGIEGIPDGLVGRSFTIFFNIKGIFFLSVVDDQSTPKKTIDFVKIIEDYEKENGVINTDKKKAEVIIANYGALKTTDRVTKLIQISNTSKVNFEASNIIFGDPNPLKLKAAGVIYKLKEKFCVATSLQNEVITIEDNDSECYTKPESTGTVRIYAAAYSGQDVTMKLRARAQEPSFNSLTVNAEDILQAPNALDYK